MLLTLALVTMACGGSPLAGPSTVAVESSPVNSTAVGPVPAWVAPELVGTLVVMDESQRPRRWEGGAFHHCFNVTDEQDLAFAREAARRMSELSGIASTDAGPCNVTWVSRPDIGHTQALIGGVTPSAILGATVELRGRNGRGHILHEAGHVLGLDHSPNVRHLMNKNTDPDGDFTADELAVLAWMYGR